MKNSIICILSFTVVLILVACISSKAETGFKDVATNAWYADDLKILLDKKIVNGYTDGTFRPEEQLTQDAFIKLMVTALGHTDVQNAETYWAVNYIDKAVEIGLLKEIGEYDSYKSKITREEMAGIIERAVTYSPYFEGYKLAKKSIKDYDKIGEEYKEGVLKTYYSGIITGYTDGTFGGQNVLTRAESVAVISRVVNENKRAFAKTLTAEELTKLKSFDRDGIIMTIENNNYVSEEKATDFGQALTRVKEIEKTNGINIIMMTKKYVQQLAYNLDAQALIEERNEFDKLFTQLFGTEREENRQILSLRKSNLISKALESATEKIVPYFETDENLIYLSSEGTIKIRGKVTLKYKDYGATDFKSKEDVKNVEVEITKDKSGKYVIVRHIELIEGKDGGYDE